MTKFNRSPGMTPSEKLLAEVCDNSFLSLWSYPNLWKKPNKELCDLLVIFGNVVIIFSDKSCEYNPAKGSEIAWKRWFKKSIAHSADQLRQAERWIRTYPSQIYLDKYCNERHPIGLPESTEIKVFRVCVAYGRPFALDPSVQGDEREDVVGQVDQGEGWIHIIDGNQLLPLLAELSTAGDFVDYLEKKEEAIANKTLIHAASELEIAAYFVHRGRSLPSASCGLCLPSGLWDSLRALEAYQKRVQRDRLSEFWDDQINKLNERYVKSELEAGNEIPVTEFERMTRFMAKERRFHRRVLSKWIIQRVLTTHEKRYEVASYMPSGVTTDLIYVLLVGTGSSREDHEEYRKERWQKLFLRCHAVKSMFPQARYIFGLAMDASRGRGGSEDYMLLDTENWTQEEIDSAQEMRAELEYFTHGQEARFVENEYE